MFEFIMTEGGDVLYHFVEKTKDAVCKGMIMESDVVELERKSDARILEIQEELEMLEEELKE